MNIFEKASKIKLRFVTDKGTLTTENLWELSLPDLDKIAKRINKELREESEESFIKTKSVASDVLTLKLEILKHIIGDKLKAQEANKKRVETNAKRQEILELIKKKQTEELGSKSVDDLMKELAALDEE